MATIPVSLFFKDTRVYRVGLITFDLILDEQHNFSNQVSSHNIENGSVVSDHIKNELITGSLSGLVTNFSINIDGLITNRAQDAFDAFETLWRERSLVDIVTILRVYNDVAITNFTVDRDDETGDALVIDLSFQEVKTVTLSSTALDVIARPGSPTSAISRQASRKLDLNRTVAN